MLDARFWMRVETKIFFPFYRASSIPARLAWAARDGGQAVTSIAEALLFAPEQFSEAVVEPQIMFESKAQTDLKAEHTR